MKKIFVLSVLTSVAMICACQKNDSGAQEQSTQPKTEPGGREEALAALAERQNSLEEKVNRLDQRVRELAEIGKNTTNARTSPADVQDQTSDPAQIKAENERLIQQLSSMIRPRSREPAGDPAKQARPAQRQLSPEDLQRQYQDKMKMAGQAVFPATGAASPGPSPAIETTSPSPSPSPE